MTKEISLEFLQKKINKLQKEIERLKLRNKKVEADKAWEVSIERKVFIIISTYIIITIVMYLLKMDKPFINAIIPTCWYILSTISIKTWKKYFLKRYNK